MTERTHLALACASLWMMATAASAQPPCEADVFLGELAPQLDKAESLIESGELAHAQRILIEVHAQSVARDAKGKSKGKGKGEAPARCSGRLLFALARVHAAMWERDAALGYLKALQAVPTRSALQAQGKELEAGLAAQVQLIVEVPAWAAAVPGELSVRSAQHAARLTREGNVWRGWVEPAAGYELMYSAELFEVLSRRVTTAASGEQRLSLDGLTIVLAPGASDLPGGATDGFDAGRAAATRGAWDEALAGFERAAAAGSHPHIEFNLAYARMKTGEVVLARDAFSALEAADVPTWLKLPAKQHRERLDNDVLATLQLQVPAGAVALRVNGRRVVGSGAGARLGAATTAPQTLAGDTMLRVGVEHPLRFELAEPRDVRITRDGKIDERPGARSFELSAAPGTRITIELGAASASMGAADADGGPALLGPVVLGAAALVTSAVTLAAFFTARSLRDEVRAGGLCEGHECDPAGKDKMDDAQSLADIATAGTVVSIAVGAAAVGWLGYELWSTGPAESSAALRLQLTPGGARARGTF